MQEPQYLDGKLVRKFLFMTYMPLIQRNHVVEVHAFSKDHAVKRLAEKYPFTSKKSWEFVQELDPEHYVGKLGETIPLLPKGAINGS